MSIKAFLFSRLIFLWVIIIGLAQADILWGCWSEQATVNYTARRLRARSNHPLVMQFDRFSSRS